MTGSASAFLAAHAFCAASRKGHGSLCSGGPVCVMRLQEMLNKADVELARHGEADILCTLCGAVVCGVENLYGHRSGKRCMRRRGGGDSKLEQCKEVSDFVTAHSGFSGNFGAMSCLSCVGAR